MVTTIEKEHIAIATKIAKNNNNKKEKKNTPTSSPDVLAFYLSYCYIL